MEANTIRDLKKIKKGELKTKKMKGKDRKA